MSKTTVFYDKGADSFNRCCLLASHFDVYRIQIRRRMADLLPIYLAEWWINALRSSPLSILLKFSSCNTIQL